MPTNEERREVARRIRMGSPEWVGDHYQKWLGPKFGKIVLSGGSSNEIEDAARLLASLIDPDKPALRGVLEDGTVVCPVCGEDIGGYGWNYCPNCGERVFDND